MAQILIPRRPDWLSLPKGPVTLDRTKRHVEHLTACWPLFGSNHLFDISGYGHHNTIVGSTDDQRMAPSVFGANVWEFGANSGDHLSNGFILDAASDWTVAFWYRLDDYSPDAYPAPFKFQTTNNGGEPIRAMFTTAVAGLEPFAFGSRGSSNMPEMQSDGAWQDSDLGQTHHIAISFNGGARGTVGNYTFYRDGILESHSAANAFGSQTNSTVIGSSEGANNPFDGQIFDMRVYDHCLTAGDIRRVVDVGTRWEIYRPIPRQTIIIPDVSGATLQALSATAIGVPDIATALSAFRDLSATAAGSATIAINRPFTQQDMDATATGSPSLSARLKAFRTLAATAVGSATLIADKISATIQALAATAVGVASIATESSFFRTLAATATGSATINTMLTAFRALVATATGVAGMTATKLTAVVQQALAATAIGVASISTRLKAFRTLAATATGVAGLGRKATFFVLLSVTAVCIPGIASATGVLNLVTMAAVAVGVASIVALYRQFFAPFTGGGGLGYSHRRKWVGPRRGWGRK